MKTIKFTLMMLGIFQSFQIYQWSSEKIDQAKDVHARIEKVQEKTKSLSNFTERFFDAE